ncbi:MAG: tetratricopeptide repeat protein [Deltaproteobacteria bacterium]|jgi:tetratricopeptide (TPR) repeat protein|nr:tetratricopeptide repeat protein [Deltaproteobacteria bacterium]
MTEAFGPYYSRMLIAVVPPRILGLITRNRFEKAQIEAERIAKSAERDFGNLHPTTHYALSALGVVLASKCDYTDAARVFRKALAGREKTKDPDSPEVEGSLSNLGLMLLRTRDYPGAVECYLRVIDIRRKRLPKGHPGIASAMIDAGFAYKGLGELKKAEAMYSRAVEIAEKACPRGHYDVTVALDGLARTRMASGARVKNVLPLLLRARENVKLSDDPDDATSTRLHVSLARAFGAAEDLAASIDSWREALRTAARNFPPNDPWIIRIETGLGLALAEADKLEEGIEHLGNAAVASRISRGRESPKTVVAEFRLETVKIYLLHRLEEVRKTLAAGRAPHDVEKDLTKAGVPEPLRNRLLAMRWLTPETGGPGIPDDPYMKPSEKPKAGWDAVGPRAAPPQSSPGRAARKARKILADRERELGPGHEDTIKAGVALGHALLSERRADEAMESYGMAREAAVKSLGPRSHAALGSELCYRLAYFVRHTQQN